MLRIPLVFRTVIPILLLPGSGIWGADFFQDQVRPILEMNCVSCHNADKAKGKLQLHSKEGLAKGGDSGAAVVGGNPNESLLLKRTLLKPEDDDIMPPTDKGGPLPAEHINVLKMWIEQGAAWPEGVVLTAKEKPKKAAKELSVPVREMQVYPNKITLETKRDFHSLIAIATFTDDVSQDVSKSAKWTLADPSIAKLEGSKLTPLKDGATTLTVAWHDKKVDVPVEVKSALAERPISFQLDVMPIMMRANCNTGSCHGAARGQDGFMLSLFGYDPEGDHFRLTKQHGGRRINLGLAEDSLLLTKSVNSVPHTGGKKMAEGDTMYATLKEWITSGAPNDKPDVAKPVNLEIFPKNAVLEGVGTSSQFTVRATYSDGTDRDVTPLAVFFSNNDPTAKVSPDGLVTAQKRGEAFVLARFETFAVGSQVIVIPDNLQYKKPEFPPNNYVDERVSDKLNKLRIIPSEVCDDKTFLRRAYIDITGSLPTGEEYSRFMTDGGADKRTRLVDELLNRKEFTDLWVMKFAELLQIRTNNVTGMSYKSTLLYFNWLKDRLGANVPIDQIVQELLASNGGTFTNPATNYYQIERESIKVAENVAQVFMGMRLQCAQCHNHPFDRWTMNDYYGFVSFFTQIGRKQAEDPRETVVFNSAGGEFPHPVTKKPQPVKFLGGEAPKMEPGADRRKILADWLASAENPFFAQNLANIVWAHFFGLGIIEPVDDVRISNPASNPELLEALGKKFTEYRYDFKRLVRDICTSRTYSLSTQVNETNAEDERNFSHSYVRRMRAEVMLDVLSQATNTPNKFRGLPLGARAVQIADGNVNNYFLRTFGRAERATVCSCEVKMDPSLSQALHLLNGDATAVRISQGKIVEEQLKLNKAPEEIVKHLYQICFQRDPLAKELEPVIKLIAENPKETRPILEDVFWAILNSKEFMFNH